MKLKGAHFQKCLENTNDITAGRAMLYWVFFSSFLSVFVKELSAAELCIGATDST